MLHLIVRLHLTVTGVIRTYTLVWDNGVAVRSRRNNMLQAEQNKRRTKCSANICHLQEALVDVECTNSVRTSIEY